MASERDKALEIICRKGGTASINAVARAMGKNSWNIEGFSRK